VTCRYDSSNCGFWDLRNNNIRNPGDFATYNITWTEGGTIDATNWTTTAPFPITIPYSYSPVTAQCVKDKLAQVAGVGKNNAQLTASTCGTATSSASSVASVASSSKASVASSSKASVASSSSKSSVASSSVKSSSSSAAAGPVLTGTGDYPTGFSKCADLGETCTVNSGDGWVAFGRKGKWVTKKVAVGGSIACTVAAFGSDPAGNPNKCSYKP
jgi:pectate lyase